MIRVTDNKGKFVDLPANATLKELMTKHGVTLVGLLKPTEPLKDGWYATNELTQQPLSAAES